MERDHHLLTDGPDNEQVALPHHLLKQIDELCDRHETAWPSGTRPDLQQYLADLAPAGRTVFLRQLVLLGQDYRRQSGEPCSLSAIQDVYEGLRQELEVQRSWLERYEKQGSSGREGERLHDSGVTGDGPGLYVRCPSCGRRVEASGDTPLPETTCAICGNPFQNLGQAQNGNIGAALPETIGHFKLVRQLGEGAFGTVWKAYDEPRSEAGQRHDGRAG